MRLQSFCAVMVGAMGIVSAQASSQQAKAVPDPRSLVLVGDRFKPLKYDEMTPEQKTMVDHLLAGERGGVRGPFNVLLRSPEVGDLGAEFGGAMRFRTGLPADVRAALARLVSVSDMEEKRPRFAEWFARLPRPQATPVQGLSHILRLRRSLPVFLFVLIPAILFAMAGAASIKWLPSLLNYSCVQASASAFRGLFAATVAGFLVGGGAVPAVEEAFSSLGWRRLL
jgi:hypothetical protein